MCRKNTIKRFRGRPKGSFAQGTLLAHKLAKFAYGAFSGKSFVPEVYRSRVKMAQKPPKTLSKKLTTIAATVSKECHREALLHVKKRDYFYRSFCAEYRRLAQSNDRKEWQKPKLAIAVKNRLIEIFGERTLTDAISVARRSRLGLDRSDVDQSQHLEHVEKSPNYSDFRMVMDALKDGKHQDEKLDLPKGWSRAMPLIWSSEV